MATNENELGVTARVAGLDKFDRDLAAMDKALARTEKDIENIAKRREAAARQAQQAEERAYKQTQQAFTDFAAKTVAIVGTLVAAYKTLEDAASFRAMVISGNNLATSYGVNFQAILDGLDEVSRGALSMEQRVLIANRAMIAGGADFADKIPQLYKIASAAARATGQDVGYVFETLTRGIAKASPLLIDNAELYLKIGGAVDEYAAQLGKSSDALTAQERQQAILNAILEQGADLVQRIGDDSANATLEFRKMEASVKDLQTTLGTAALEITNSMGRSLKNVAGDTLSISDGFVALGQIVAITAASVILNIELVRGVVESLIASLPGNAAKSKSIEEILSQARRTAGQALLNIGGVTSSTEAQRAAGAQATALQKANQEAAAELKKRNEDMKKYGEKLADLQIKAGESLLDAEKDFQAKSADAWRDYIEKTNDIVADGVKARAKIQQQYNDKITEAERDYQRGVEDLNINHGQKMADIEADYQRRIAEIQGQYQVDALDAIRNLDAIALIRAKERRDKDMASARTDRDQQIGQEQNDYQQSLNELVRALSDKRREAEDDRRRELDEQRRGEQEKQQDAKNSYNQQMADAQRAFNDKIASIRQNYQQEDVEAQAHYLNQEAQLRNHLIAMQNIMRTYGLTGGGTVTSPTRVPGGGYRRAEGGVDVVTQPTQFTAGEAGPELAIFAPLNRALPSPIMQTINHVGDFSHSVDAAITSSVAGLDGRIMAAVRKALGEVIR